MVFRKLPGVSASGMGLRLSQKFMFLLFLSGLVTLCFGALFFLPDSVRLKRIFLSKTEIQPVTVGSGSENDVREHLKRPKDQGMTSAKGEAGIKLKSQSRKPPVSYETTEVRLAGGKAQEDLNLSRSKTESASEKVTSSNHGANSDTFSYKKFRRCLFKPPLGRDSGRPADPQTNERREKVKEVRKPLWLCCRNIKFDVPARGGWLARDRHKYNIGCVEIWEVNLTGKNKAIHLGGKSRPDIIQDNA